MAKAKVKVISLRQPWAYLYAIGAKKYETRDWQAKHRGELYIHASAKVLFSDLELCRDSEHFRKYIPDHTNGILVQGAIIGKVTLTDIVTTESIRESLSAEERAFGDYGDGRYAWKGEGAMLLPKPIPVSGKLSIWEYDMDITEELEEYQEPGEPDLMGRDYREDAEGMWDIQRNLK